MAGLIVLVTGVTRVIGSCLAGRLAEQPAVERVIGVDAALPEPAARARMGAADFARVDGIHQGSDVRISGIKVGTVVADALDPKTYLATIRMSIDPDVQLPDDTVAQVTSSGLLGDKYMSLAPGGSDKMIPAGGKIQYTQSSISLENLIGQMMFSTPGSKPTAEGGASSPGPETPQAAAPPLATPDPVAPVPAAPR